MQAYYYIGILCNSLQDYLCTKLGRIHMPYTHRKATNQPHRPGFDHVGVGRTYLPTLPSYRISEMHPYPNKPVKAVVLTDQVMNGPYKAETWQDEWVGRFGN